MEWNLKIPAAAAAAAAGCWDFDQETTIPNLSNNNNNGGSSSSSLNFSVDLKLGQVIDSRRNDDDDEYLNSKMPNILTPSGSSKRARPVNNNPIHSQRGAANIYYYYYCLVDGCKADLSNSKEYHRRHKVCEIHSKTPQVSINGQNQRFCQQCSRFHSLEEFDEGKRSCRKRLDGHNRRRRKPQPDTSHASNLFSTHQGTTMIQFSSPHVYQTSTLTSPLWTGLVKSGEDPEYLNRAHKQNPFPQSSSGINKVSSREQPQCQFSLFHNGCSGSHLKIGQQQLLSFGSNNNNSSSSSYDKFCDEYPAPARVVQPVVQSDFALSLLSSSPSQTSCSTPNHVMQPPNSFNATPNQLDPGVGYGVLDSIMDHHHHVSPDNEAPPTLAFYWE